jgi:hypothetical protein
MGNDNVFIASHKVWSSARKQILQQLSAWRMPSSGMLRYVALVRTDISEEHCNSVIRVTRMSEPGTTLAVSSNQRTLQRSTILVTLMMEELHSFKTLALRRATWCNIPEDSILIVTTVITSNITMQCMFRYSAKISWQTPQLILTMSGSSWTVRWLSSCMNSQIVSTFSVDFLVPGCPECSPSSNDTRLALKHECYSETTVQLGECSQKAPKLGTDILLNFAIHCRQNKTWAEKALVQKQCMFIAQFHLAYWCNRLEEVWPWPPLSYLSPRQL